MERRNLKWNKRALRRVDEIAIWYEQNVGEKARRNFLDDTFSTIERLRLMPSIGLLERKDENAVLYSFVSHPLIRIVYNYTDTDITIVAIRSTRMKNNKSK